MIVPMNHAGQPGDHDVRRRELRVEENADYRRGGGHAGPAGTGGGQAGVHRVTGQLGERGTRGEQLGAIDQHDRPAAAGHDRDGGLAVP